MPSDSPSSAGPSTALPSQAPFIPASHDRRLLLILTVLALGICLYLSWVSFNFSPVLGCGPGSSCASVLSSHWARWLDLPVSALASAGYLLALGALIHLPPAAAPSLQRQAWFILLVLSCAIPGAALWFIALQAFVLRSFCNWCMAAHVLGLSWSSLVIFQYFRLHRAHRPYNLPFPLPSFWRNTAFVLGLLSTAALICGQVFFPSRTFVAYRAPAPALEGSGSDRILTLLGGRVLLRPHSLPVIGSPDAPHLIVVLTDYTCPNCRLMHQFLHRALTRHPSQLALILVHVPLDHRCNDMFQPPLDPSQQQPACDLARLALALWKTAPDQFPHFDAWLMDPQTWSVPDPPDLQAAHRCAAALLGTPDRLEQALADPWPDQQVQRNVTLAKLINMRRLPMLFVGRIVVEGRPVQADEIIRLIESEFHLSPPASR